MSILQFEILLMVLAAVCVITSIPLAIISIRRSREQDAQPPIFPAMTLSPLQEQTRDRFIATQTRATKFGDRRRRTKHVTELLRPETGPIALPDEHVPTGDEPDDDTPEGLDKLVIRV